MTTTTTVQRYRLDPAASPLDRATLRLLKWWHGRGRDFVHAYLLTQLTVTAVLSLAVTSVGLTGSWATAGAGLALIAPVAAWIASMRRHGVAPRDRNQRARRWGAGLAVLFLPVTGWAFFVPLSMVAVLVSMLSAQGPLALLPAIGAGFAGWAAAAYRRHQLDNPLYP